MSAAAAAASSSHIPPYLSFRAVVVGNAAVGKSCLIQRFVKGDYTGLTPATPGAEFSNKIFQPDELEQQSLQLDQQAQQVFAKLPVQITAVDMPGQDSLASVTPMALRNADATFVCFDIADQQSYQDVEKWLKKVLRQSPQAMPVLVACKCDLDDVRLVSKSEADVLAKKFNMMYFETSAKQDSNVLPTFRFVATHLRQRWYANLKAPAKKSEERVQPNKADLTSSAPIKQEKKCCG